MEPAIVSAIITGATTVFGAIVGAVLGRSEVADNLFRRDKFLRIVGKWESTWKEIGNESSTLAKELLVIERQKGSKIWGYIDMESEPDKRWDFEGNFNGRFLQLMYYPSKKSNNQLFLDYGCYFFELQGDGKFNGYSIGFSWDLNKTYPSTHQLKRVR